MDGRRARGGGDRPGPAGTDLTPSPSRRLPLLVDEIEQPFGGWARLAEHRPDHLDPWVEARLDQLARLAARGRAALAGDTVVHTDIRADNLLIGADGAVTVVDWPWGSVGAAWFDRLCLVINADLYGGHDPECLVEDHLGAVPAADITAVLAGMCGYFTDAARQPVARGLPTVRSRPLRRRPRWPGSGVAWALDSCRYSPAQ